MPSNIVVFSIIMVMFLVVGGMTTGIYVAVENKKPENKNNPVSTVTITFMMLTFVLLGFVFYGGYYYYTNKTFKHYIYYIPLCTKLFNDTDTNIKNENNKSSFFGLKYIYLYFIKSNKLDKQSQPGFNNFYFYSKIISIFMFILLFYIIYLFYKVGKYIL